MSGWHTEWANVFEQERGRMLTVLGNLALSIEHVGSTAIPGVPAKPILDIVVGVDNFESATACIEPLQLIGYHYRGEYGVARRHYFVKGEPRTHHLHMLELDSEQWRLLISFRDLLRADPALAASYAETKRVLADQFAHQRQAYQQAKDEWIEGLLRELKLEDPHRTPAARRASTGDRVK
nr:GrpB family protein [Pseudomarimonas arenosa]